MKFLKHPISLFCCAVLLLSACAKSPTGRNQLLLHSNNDLAVMGTQAFDDMKTQQKVSSEGKVNAYVNCVADAIIKHVPDKVFDGKWEVVVFDSDQINAFALPGGKIGVYTGILKVAEDQDQLAAIIGHEVGHVIANHGNERVSNSMAMGVGMEVVNIALKTQQVSYNREIMSALGLGVQVGLQLPFSRSHESEADLIGLTLMSQSGFNPEGSVKLWQNMSKASGDQRQPEFLSTHPIPETRIKQLQENMGDAQKLAASSKDSPSCSPN
jgi:predicted Zn-dependent protease